MKVFRDQRAESDTLRMFRDQRPCFLHHHHYWAHLLRESRATREREVRKAKGECAEVPPSAFVISGDDSRSIVDYI